MIALLIIALVITILAICALVVISAGMPFGTPGMTNLLRIAEVGSQTAAALDL